jgi:Pvc16 N-terminal domain
VSVLAAPAPVLSGVDTVLGAMTRDAVGTLITVTNGPLDRPASGARLNWFLYRITPTPALMNMEPPQSGWTTRRGRPPLALTLHYLLTADPGELTVSGNEVPPVHDALTAVMLLLHEHAILGPDTVITSSPAQTVSQVTTALDGLVEPLRITLDAVPLETITGLWASGLKALRLSVAYQVSLVTVPSPVPFEPGPPVQEPVVTVSPSTGPQIVAVAPGHISFGRPVTITLTGATQTVDVTISRSDGDPDDPTDGRPNPGTTHSTGPWQLATTPVAGGLRADLPNSQLVPGRRVLTVTNLAGGWPAGSDSAPVTVAPAISAGPALQAGATATLQVSHVLAQGRVAFLGMTADYTLTSPNSVTVTVPAGVAAYADTSIAVSVESGTIVGPPTELAVAP